MSQNVRQDLLTLVLHFDSYIHVIISKNHFVILRFNVQLLYLCNYSLNKYKLYIIFCAPVALDIRIELK